MAAAGGAEGAEGGADGAVFGITWYSRQVPRNIMPAPTAYAIAAPTKRM